jgi:acyl dehydratase
MVAREIRVLDALPPMGRLLLRAGVSSLGRSGSESGAVLPDRSAQVLAHASDVHRFAAYARVCGFTLRDQVPPTWLHVLTFPLQTYLMAERDFPFALAGLVHVSNDMTLHRPVLVTERLRLGVHARNPQPHRRGTTFDLVGEAHVGDELVWSGTSTYLAPGAAPPAGDAQSAPRPDVPQVPLDQQWRLPADLGRRYAAVSGDVNPIHLSPLTSRPFGFARPLVHGAWTHARALAALEGGLGDAYRVQVRFTRPIALPATVRFGSADGEEGRHLAVTNMVGDKPYLVGVLTAASA